MKAGFQVAIHAIGDAGNREALDILEAVFDDDPSTQSNRHRIEHAQVIHPDDIPRLGQLGVIASMEPPHAMEDKTWAETRVGPERILGAYAWRSLRESGAALTFNSEPGLSELNVSRVPASRSERHAYAPRMRWGPSRSSAQVVRQGA